MEISEIIKSYGRKINKYKDILSAETDAIMKEQLQEIVDTMTAKEREDILQAHRQQHKVWSGNNVWKTYLPDPDASRGIRLIQRSTLAELEKEIVDFYKVCSRPTTFDDMYWLYRKRHDRTICDNTIRRYDTDYIRFFKNEPFVDTVISDIDANDIAAFISEKVIECNLCKGALLDLYQIIGAVFKMARRSYYIQENPMLLLDGAKEFYHLTTPSKQSQKYPLIPVEAWLKIYAKIEEDEKKGYMTIFAVDMESLTANRVGELAAFRWDHIHDGIIEIRHAWELNRITHEYEYKSLKNGAKGERDIAITEEIDCLLQKIRKEQFRQGITSEWVFANRDGWITPGAISSAIKNKCKQLHLPETYSLYNLRKTCNSVGKNKGVTEANAAFCLGNTIAVNDTYYTHDVRTLDEKIVDFEKMSLKKWASEHLDKQQVNTKSTQVNTLY